MRQIFQILVRFFSNLQLINYPAEISRIFSNFLGNSRIRHFDVDLIIQMSSVSFQKNSNFQTEKGYFFIIAIGRTNEKEIFQFQILIKNCGTCHQSCCGVVGFHPCV